ncbi:MAG: AtpZ/AtpI family protein [Pyrinomonadaceae bacterium]
MSAEIAFNKSVEKIHGAEETAMIKNLLDADEDDSLQTKSEVGKNDAAVKEIFAPHFSEADDANDLLEIPGATIDAPQNFETTSGAVNYELPSEAKIEEAHLPDNNEMLFQTSVQPESTAETARQSGLAYGAAITLFGAVVFMLIIGWGADLLLGTSPWGIVVGIALGAIIGFFQFFRITSQIFKK